MQPMGSLRRFTLFVAAVAAAVGALAQAPAAAASTCAFDAATGAVSATIDPGTPASLRVAFGEIWFGFSPAPCGGATAGNTTSITVHGAPGSRESLIVDYTGGALPV